MNPIAQVSADKRKGEHPEKSEISRNLTIVDAPEGRHTIRYVSMDWSRLCAPLRWRHNSPAPGRAMAIRTRAGNGVRQARSARLRSSQQQPAKLPPGDRVGSSPYFRPRPSWWTARTALLRASAAARAFGIVKGDRLMVSELAALARQVRRDGEIREAEFEVAGCRASAAGPPPSRVRVAPLSGTVGRVAASCSCSPKTRLTGTGV